MEIEVAIPSPLHQTFTYLHQGEVKPGTRVMVPFGPRKVVGVALGKAPPSKEGARKFKLRAITSVIDPTPIYSQPALELARWISSYYMHPLGEVLRAMLPASVSKTTKETFDLTEAGKNLVSGNSLGLSESNISSDSDSANINLLRELFGKRTSLTSATVKKKLKKLSEEYTNSSISPDNRNENVNTLFDQMIKLKLVSLKRDRGVKARKTQFDTTDSSRVETSGEIPTLTTEQQNALEQLVSKGLDDISESSVHSETDSCKESSAKSGNQINAEIKRKPFLLHGVTGSGKTEVYLNFIQKTIDHYRKENSEILDAQTLVLVPEISLTPQMTYVFEKRFPNQVAVVHSQMSDTARWEQLDRIRSGKAKILIGPRSAVFGPFSNLQLIIVDEEHDSSYKQTTGLCYHGRDVAIVRAKIENCSIILGSATPSLETFWNANIEKYHYIRLKNRVGNRPLPTVETIIAKPGSSRGVMVTKYSGTQSKPSGEENSQYPDDQLPIAKDIIQALKTNKEEGNQAIVLVNRRGYAYYLFDLNEKAAFLCKNCSISMTLHSRSTVLRCHYCDHKTTLEEARKEKPNAKYVAVGYGSQKAEDCLNEVLPKSKIVRLDSDSIAQKDYLPKTLEKFRNHEIDVLVGTQILAKGHDFPKVTLIVILEVDQLLNLPDFRAGEKTFQLLVQAAGRAGRSELPGHVLVQSSKSDHPVVQAGLEQNYEKFAKKELEFRKAHSYPPFGKLIYVELNSESPSELSKFCDQIDRWLERISVKDPEIFSQVKVLGPTVPSIETIRKRHRRTILFSASKLVPLRKAVSLFLATFHKLPKNLRMNVDIDPQTLI